MKTIILGAGLVGGPMAIDLAGDSGYEVTITDRDQNALDALSDQGDITLIRKDLSDPADVTSLVSDYDIVINAVPGFMGFRTLKAIIEAEKDVIDIAFFPEDPFALDPLAREKGVTAIMDCGVAPGMSNILAGYAHNILDETDTILIYVGGLPEVRQWPWEYKAVFSPVDVIEEYTRPARYVENGTLVVREALSDPELIEFPRIGTLEAFNSDGLRTLGNTLNANNMKEKTLRYPGHIQKMAVLRDTGFFSQEEIEINGSRIRPLDFTAKLLFPKWKLEEGEIDITVMRVIVEGTGKSGKLRYTWDLYDRLDESTGIHSMARTTGYTATMAARMIAEGLFSKKGVSPPEIIGLQPECVEFILDGLKERGIIYSEKIEELG
ncbi:MAG: saccharopine dehydrogenase family protein [Bacteroidales bacterium]|nr:saccharopine dehydrogenase family protein [Candidatus Latescibacterota bacterium]